MKDPAKDSRKEEIIRLRRTTKLNNAQIGKLVGLHKESVRLILKASNDSSLNRPAPTVEEAKAREISRGNTTTAKQSKKEEGLICCTLEEFNSPPIRSDMRGAKAADISGEVVDGCVIEEFVGYKVFPSSGAKDSWWRVRCKCGEEFLCGRNNLGTAKRRKSLDCQGIRHLPVKPGDVVGRLKIESLFYGPGQWWASCSCSCGAYPEPSGRLKDIRLWDLDIPGIEGRKARTSSCGCLLKERAREANLIHGASVARSTDPAFYKAWLMLRNASARAEKSSVKFSLDLEDIQPMPEFCPVLGLRLDYESESLSDNSATLDRLIPSLGYVKGNVAVISQRANRIKNDATADELIQIGSWLKKRLGL